MVGGASYFQNGIPGSKHSHDSALARKKKSMVLALPLAGEFARACVHVQFYVHEQERAQKTVARSCRYMRKGASHRVHVSFRASVDVRYRRRSKRKVCERSGERRGKERERVEEQKHGSMSPSSIATGSCGVVCTCSLIPPT